MYNPWREEGERGSAMMVVIVAAIIASAGAAAMLTLSVNSQRQSHHQIGRTRARMAVEGAHHRVHQLLYNDANWDPAVDLTPPGVMDMGGVLVTITKVETPPAGSGKFTLTFTVPDYDDILSN